MFKIPEASRGLVQSFAQACLNLRHYRPDNILVHLSQRLLSPGVICDSSLIQLGFPTSLEIQKNLSKVVCLWNMTHHPLQPGQWLSAFQSSEHELPTRLLLIPFSHHTSSQFCKARRFGRDCWCDEKKELAMNTQQELTLKASSVGSLTFSGVCFGKFSL